MKHLSKCLESLTFLNYVKSEKLEGTNYSFVKMIEHVYVTFLR